jgi:hypothetical protein
MVLLPQSFFQLSQNVPSEMEAIALLRFSRVFHFAETSDAQLLSLMFSRASRANAGRGAPVVIYESGIFHWHPLAIQEADGAAPSQKRAD